MSLNDAYHIVMMVVGIFGVILSTVLAVWTIYTGSRKLKNAPTNGVEKKATSMKKIRQNKKR